MGTMVLKACFRGRSSRRHPLFSHLSLSRGCNHGLLSSSNAAVASAPSVDFGRPGGELSSYMRSPSARLHLIDSKLRIPWAQCFCSTQEGSSAEDGELSVNNDESEADSENEICGELELTSTPHFSLPDHVQAEHIGYKVVGQVKPGDFGSYRAPKAFAVVQVGSHQFKISPGDCIYTEKLKFADVNDKLSLEKILLLGSKSQTIIGRPLVPEALVHAVVEEQVLDAKVIIFKKKRRKNYRRCNGHRQELTRLRILDIWGLGEARSAAAVRQSPNSLMSPVQTARNYSTISARYPLPLSGALSSRTRFCSTVPQDISITENCVNRLREIIREEKSTADEKMLRVSVEGGGCSGFQYVFSLESMLNDADRIFEKDGVKIVVDEVSIGFLKGATIDYAEELIRASFMVTSNPNASGGCGCGSSFVAK